jgi:Predicted permease
MTRLGRWRLPVASGSVFSYAAVALARSLFRKGANFRAAIAFEFASTNLVIELGIIMGFLLGSSARWRESDRPPHAAEGIAIGRGFRIASATTTPDSRVSVATRWIAAARPARSATAPDSSAPTAYPRSRQKR